jgi:hypothetical protein
MHCFEPHYWCHVNIVALKLIMSLWSNDVVFTSDYVQRLHVSDNSWPIPQQSCHWRQLQSIRLPLSVQNTFIVVALCCILFVNVNFLSSLILTAYILWLQQTRTADSEVLPTILPIQPPTLLQNPKTTEYHQNWVCIQLVYHIRRFIFIHYH